MQKFSGDVKMEILGIDIGGSGIKGAPVNIKTGTLTADRYRLKTPKGAEPEPVAAVVAEVVKHFEWKGPVGIGFPAPIKHGVAKMAANISKAWVGLNVDELFSQATGCAVVTMNDADAAGLAEMTFGAGKGQKGSVIMITLGTGIGTAIFYGGKLFPNAEFGQLEIKGAPAEARASAAAREQEDLPWKKYAKRLNRYLATMEMLFWPDLFIVGGGISKEHEKFIPLLKIDAPIIPAQFFNEAGIVGAALAAKSMAAKQG
jgi:polyphosphate glucokinase